MSPRPSVAISGAGRPRGASKGPRLWMISAPGARAPWLAEGGRELPVFNIEEEAEAFLLSRGLSSGGWTTREVGPRESLAVLLGLAGVEKVLLDPIPGVADAVSSCLVGVSRQRFAGRLLEYLRNGRRRREAGSTGGAYG